MLGFSGIGLLLFWRRSDDWLAMFVGMMLILTGLIHTDPPTNYVMPLWVIAFLTGLGEAFQVIFFYIFPNGKFFPSAARWLVVPLLIWRPLMWGISYLPNVFTNITITAENYGHVQQDSLDIGLMTGLLLVGIIAQIYRYRRLSTRTQRQQVKWLLVGFMISFV